MTNFFTGLFGMPLGSTSNNLVEEAAFYAHQQQRQAYVNHLHVRMLLGALTTALPTAGTIAVSQQAHQQASEYYANLVPDGIGTITAWRGWAVGNSFLVSMYRDTTWYPKQVVQSNSTGHGDCPPHNCQCGIYALKNYKTAIEGLLEPPMAVGLVELWGVIHEHTHGYRAQYAKIVKVFTNFVLNPNYDFPIEKLSKEALENEHRRLQENLEARAIAR